MQLEKNEAQQDGRRMHTEAAALHHNHSVGLVRRQVVQRPDRVVPNPRVGGRGAVVVQHRQRIRGDDVSVVVALLTQLLSSNNILVFMTLLLPLCHTFRTTGRF